MKTNVNKMNSQSTQPNTNDRRLNEDRLYNLVFAGKITLKEYLQEITKREAQKQAA